MDEIASNLNPEELVEEQPTERPKIQTKVIWRPQVGPQKALLDCPFPLILFGGARGGGKTDGVLGKWAFKALKYRHKFNAVFFRKEMPQQDDLIERAKQIYLPLGGMWAEQKKQFVLPGGGKIRFRPLENLDDAEKYQGQNLTDAAVEEAGNYEDKQPIFRLFGCLRSARSVPVQLILTANPGGPGQSWLKEMFIDPAPLGMKKLTKVLPNGSTFDYVYIPSKVTDNQIMLLHDPGYVDRLHMTGSEALVRAWLNGDWTVIEGAFFDEWGPQHIIKPCILPPEWLRFRAFDWGSASPFACLWFCVADAHKDYPFPAGSLICYREYYGGTAGIGLKMRNEDVAKQILEREATGENIVYSVADPSIFKEDGGPSIAETFAKSGVLFRPADNKRILGAQQVRSRLVGQDGKPMIYFFSTCINTIRTLPSLQHDDKHNEDVDTKGDDHCYDAVRYGCASRPYILSIPEKPKLVKTYNDVLGNMFERRKTFKADWKRI